MASWLALPWPGTVPASAPSRQAKPASGTRRSQRPGLACSTRCPGRDHGSGAAALQRMRPDRPRTIGMQAQFLGNQQLILSQLAEQRSPGQVPPASSPGTLVNARLAGPNGPANPDRPPGPAGPGAALLPAATPAARVCAESAPAGRSIRLPLPDTRRTRCPRATSPQPCHAKCRACSRSLSSGIRLSAARAPAPLQAQRYTQIPTERRG